MFLYGQGLPSAKPMVTITNADIHHSSWISVQEQLRHSFLHNSKLDLQLVEDDLNGPFQSHSHLGCRSQREYRLRLPLGHSMGVETLT